MYLAEDIKEKWSGVMNHEDLPEITDPYKRDVTLRLLENQESFLNEAAPTNSMLGSNSSSGSIRTWDPILISLVRRAMPQMIAYDVCGVQPMTGPTGLIFAMKAKYDNQTSADEAFFGEAETHHSGTGTHTALDATNNPFAGTWVTGTADTTANQEALGATGGTAFKEMAFSIEQKSVTARSRALKAEYSTELAQDLKAVHGLDAETELANILSTEIMAEINREVVRRIYINARKGAESTAHGVTTDGTFDLDTDSNGRWSVEKFKGLMFQIERDRNSIAFDTRRGKGNFMICSSDVASALSMSGMLETGHGVTPDVTGSTMVGTFNGMKVFVDPYYGTVAGQFYVVGYKGTSAYDAGMFYCPYVPLEMVRAMGENTFQPKIGFKTRYGMVDNPFVTGENVAGTTISNGNQYYRKVKVNNLM